MKLFSRIISLCFIVSGCLLPDKDNNVRALDQDINNLSWILGNWEIGSENKFFEESWHKENDSTYTGTSMMLMEGDTLFTEILVIKYRENNLVYLPQVNNQNNNIPVSFKLIASAKDEFVFENKEHDFPQRICYKRLSKDSIIATIEGVEHGSFRREKFPMSRK